jgi:hypothetical protein
MAFNQSFLLTLSISFKDQNRDSQDLSRADSTQGSRQDRVRLGG